MHFVRSVKNTNPHYLVLSAQNRSAGKKNHTFWHILSIFGLTGSYVVMPELH